MAGVATLTERNKARAGASWAPIRRYRVLVVDDDPGIRDLLCRCLENEPYELACAPDGLEALQMITAEKPDLILLDVAMPRMDGFRLIGELRKREDTHMLPVVMMTAELADSAHRIEGLNAGADDFLYKSQMIETELVAKVRTMLRAKQAQDEVIAHLRENERLNKELASKNRQLEEYNENFRKSMEMARQVQQALLPPTHMRFDGATIELRYMPCDQLGGDFIDYAVKRDMLNLVLADVSGHGLPASQLVSLIKSLCHRELRAQICPTEFLLKLNDLLHDAVSEGHFATACFLQYDSTSKQLVYCNAGGPEFLLHRRETGEVLVGRHPGPLLGLWNQPTFERIPIPLQSGDRVLVFTDGLLDRRSRDMEMLELGRVEQAMHESRNGDLSDCLEHICETAERFAQGAEHLDDVAIVGLDIH